ncbi:MAG: threonine/serine exporter family protein [Planctomycetes bacterium]|nr:threonine/serine exporter family protein [Planctomycetota bacterium]MBL7007588.1 threonine/serine exporter family protein [Planctomycetota bacterium]
MSPRTNASPEITFALKLAKALHRYGTPAHRLEDVLVALSDRLGVQGSFFSTPTALFASFEGGGEESTHMQRFQDSDTDLGKLSDLDALFNDVWFQRIDLEEAARRVDQLIAAPPRYGRLAVFLSFGLASGGAARFFGGGLAEMLLATLAGFGLGLVVFARARLPWLKRLFEPVGALVVTLIVMAGVACWPGASADQAILGGLIVMVPGFSLTVAITELATRHLVSGTARMSASLVLLLMLGFGVIFGQQLGTLMFGAAVSATPTALPEWTVYATLPVAAATISLLFQVPLRDFPWVFLVSMAGFLGVKGGSEWLGPRLAQDLADPHFGSKLGVFLGALLVGAGSNLYANLLDRPASVTRLPGMLFLVPGGFSFLSISDMMQGNALQGLETAFQVAVILTSLVVGFLVSNALVPPRKIL